MEIWSSLDDLRVGLRPLRAQALAFVPTMGNLHPGHLSLIRQAQAAAPSVVVSIFVNPLQFGPNEDFERYPRTFEQDCAQLEALGVQGIFAPSTEMLYPAGMDAHTQVRVPALGEDLCGVTRPRFFAGVTTVVNILFNLVRPDIAVFGEKDWQQLVILRKMTADLHLPIRIDSGPTVRETDGLALSSRNQYLSPTDRAKAPGLFRQLQATAQGLEQGERDFEHLAQQGAQALSEQGFQVDYFALRDAETLGTPSLKRPIRVLAAAWLGQTRLIDNIGVGILHA